ncbi:MAG: adenylate/guanylate cyclase domain-containing protein, partial [Candidatus Riflebacteria bacterium]
MSVKFSSFDAMTRQNKITALMHIKELNNHKRDDYYLALHAMLDTETQVSLAAKMIVATFSGQPWVQNFGSPTAPDFRDKIGTFLRQKFGFGPEVIDGPEDVNRQLMNQNLQKKQKKFETYQEWDGIFPQSARILNTLREDTQSLISSLLIDGEKVEKAWLCFYNEALQPFRDSMKSLDGAAAATVVNLARINQPGKISPILQTMFEKLNRPIYLLLIVTSKRGLIFLRDELKTTSAAVVGFNLQTIIGVKTIKEGNLINLEIETPQDFIIVPCLESNDAYEISRILREKSVETIEADEEFIDRDFDNELRKLDMLFRAKTLTNSEYIFRKSRLQKMELEKFSDANIEILLTKRFSDSKLGEKFDQQLLKKFTFEKTVMFTDIVGFSSAASQKMLLDTMTLLAVHDKLLMPVIAEKQGTLIKKIGDALMVRFDDPIGACEAAIEMQQRLAEFNAGSEEKIFVRIGINTGTVFVKNEDVFGDAVNVAARMEALAKPGMIFI